jgi:threonine synthase
MATTLVITALRHLLAEGTIAEDARVACVLTGPTLKDADATVNYRKDRQGEFSNPPVETPNDLQEIIRLIE